MMCKTTAQSPMTDNQIATLNNITLDEANSMLDKLYEGKAISSVKNIKGGIEQRLVWLTGLPYRPALSISKEVAWQHLRTPITQPQPIEPKQDITMDDKKTIDLIVPNNLLEAGIKTPQKIVRFLFANSKATSNEIRKNCQIDFVDPFIKAYVRKGYIERTKNQDNLAVYAITPKGRLLGSADALYNHARVKHPSKMVIPKKSDVEIVVADTPTPNLIIQEQITEVEELTPAEKEEYADAIKELPADFFDSPFPSDIPTIEFKLEQKQHIRFALTDEGTLMILGVQYEPIELSKEDTRRLYDFAENTVHAI
jgi:predicted transcriptional regulator